MQISSTLSALKTFDNMTIRGIEDLKLKAVQWMQQQQIAAQENANKPTPEQELINAEVQIETARIAQRQEEAEGNLTIKAAQVANEKEKTNIEFLRLLAEIEGADLEHALEVEGWILMRPKKLSN